MPDPFFDRVRANSPQAKIDDAASRIGSIPIHGFPTDTPKYYSVIMEHEWSMLGGSVNVPGIGELPIPTDGIHLTAAAAYRLPLPTHIIDGHEVHYDHGYNWFTAAVAGVGVAAQPALGIAGYALNNFKYVTLQAPQFRQYAFEWRLAPRDRVESENIRRIYMGIKRGMHPRRRFSRVAFEFPRIFWIGFYPNADYLVKFKPAVITSCLLDFQSGNPQPTFYKTTEAPEGLVMRLSFLELEVWTRENFATADARMPGQPADPFDTADWYTKNY